MTGRVNVAAPTLLAAGTALVDDDVDLGRHTLLEALDAAFMRSGTVDDPETSAIAAAARRAPRGNGSIVDVLLDAFADYVSTGYEQSVPALRAAVTVACRDDVPAESLIRWSFLVTSIATALWDHDAHQAVMNRLMTVARDRGSINWLAVGLQSSAHLELSCGRFDAADALYRQAAEIYAELEQTPGAAAIVGIHADTLRGRDAAARASAERVIAIANTTGLGVIGAAAHEAMVLLEIGRGRYAQAVEHAAALIDRFPISVSSTVLPNMVEAALRAGQREVADRAMQQLTRRAEASGSAWARGLLARTTALMDDEHAEPRFDDAIAILDATPLGLDAARAHLLYGEWLRRQGRRLDARAELRTAYDSFSTMGADPFAQRAADELDATGERVHTRRAGTSTELTPQEAHVARLAAAGETNATIAAQLFVSIHTVEYHLRKVFRKLGVTSRRQLGAALAASTVPAQPERHGF